MTQSNYEAVKSFNVFSMLGFEHIPETDNESIYYLYHPVLKKEVFVEKKDAVDFGFIQYQLTFIGFNEIFFDSLYEHLE